MADFGDFEHMKVETMSNSALGYWLDCFIEDYRKDHNQNLVEKLGRCIHELMRRVEIPKLWTPNKADMSTYLGLVCDLFQDRILNGATEPDAFKEKIRRKILAEQSVSDANALMNAIANQSVEREN